MSDVYTPYELGLQALLERLGRDHPRTPDALIYQQRLAENIAASRRYGDTEGRHAERAELVDRLNALAMEALDVSYTELCQAAGQMPEVAPPPGGSIPPHINTGGGAYIGGNVTVQGGSFVGRDQVVDYGSIPTPPPSRPPVPAEGEPQALITAALEARRLLLVWAGVPFPPEERLPGPEPLFINRLQREAESLEPFPWPVSQLVPATLLSLDPGDRIESAFREAGVRLNVLCTQHDVLVPGRHNLIKLGGDLPSRSGLLLTWADVRDAPNDPDKVHLLGEARRVARDGVALALAGPPSDALARLWRELLAPVLRAAAHRLAVGPPDFPWPPELTYAGADLPEIQPAPSEARSNTVSRSKEWNSAAVRELLSAAFSDEELTSLCFDRFHAVYENFSTGMSKGQKVQFLLDHCVRRQRLDELLGYVEERNSAQYARFRDRLGG